MQTGFTPRIKAPHEYPEAEHFRFLEKGAIRTEWTQNNANNYFKLEITYHNLDFIGIEYLRRGSFEISARINMVAFESTELIRPSLDLNSTIRIVSLFYAASKNDNLRQQFIHIEDPFTVKLLLNEKRFTNFDCYLHGINSATIHNTSCNFYLFLSYSNGDYLDVRIDNVAGRYRITSSVFQNDHETTNKARFERLMASAYDRIRQEVTLSDTSQTRAG